MPEWLIGLVCKTNDFVLVGSNPTLNSKKKYTSVAQGQSNSLQNYVSGYRNSPLVQNGSMAQRQLHLTVNQTSFEFVGSSPTTPTKLSFRLMAGHFPLTEIVEVRILQGQQLVS